MSKIHLSPEEILQEMFHSEYYENFEGERICPTCETDFGEHYDLINHIEECHPETLHFYVDDLNKMLKDPYQYFSQAAHGGMDTCTICGRNFLSKGEFNRHMLSEHDADIKWFREEFGEKNE